MSKTGGLLAGFAQGASKGLDLWINDHLTKAKEDRLRGYQKEDTEESRAYALTQSTSSGLRTNADGTQSTVFFNAEGTELNSADMGDNGLMTQWDSAEYDNYTDQITAITGTEEFQMNPSPESLAEVARLTAAQQALKPRGRNPTATDPTATGGEQFTQEYITEFGYNGEAQPEGFPDAQRAPNGYWHEMQDGSPVRPVLKEGQANAATDTPAGGPPSDAQNFVNDRQADRNTTAGLLKADLHNEGELYEFQMILDSASSTYKGRSVTAEERTFATQNPTSTLLPSEDDLLRIIHSNLATPEMKTRAEQLLGM